MKKHSPSPEKSSSKRGSSKSTTPRRSVSSSPAQEVTSTRLEVIKIPVSKSEPPAMSQAGPFQEVRFGYFKPEAHEVFLVGSFNGWNPCATPMKRDSLGDWSVQLSLPPGEYHYRLKVDGEWRDDPSAPRTAMNPFGGFDAVVVI